MDTIFFTLACWLLALSFAVPSTEKPTTHGLTETNTITDLTPSNSPVPVTVITTPTKDTTTLTSASDSHTFIINTSTTIKSTEPLQTLRSTTVKTSITNNSSVTTETPGSQTPPLTALTTPTAHTTTGFTSSSDTTVITTADSSTVNIASQSVHTPTQGLGLNTAERTLTIVFCCILGVCAVVLVVFIFHRCKHKLQYVHRPLNNTDTIGGAFTTDDDTLVISGGLYDGHPIYDNIPTPRTDESQFRLEFLH